MDTNRRNFLKATLAAPLLPLVVPSGAVASFSHPGFSNCLTAADVQRAYSKLSVPSYTAEFCKLACLTANELRRMESAHV